MTSFPGQRPPDWKAPDGSPAPGGPKGCLSLVLIACGVLVIILVLGSVVGPPQKENGSAVVTQSPRESTKSTDNMASSISTAQASGSPENISNNWNYSSSEDKVRGGKSYFATTISTNRIDQSFPYSSDTSMELTVRKSPSAGLDIIFTVSSGQLMCPSYEGCSGTVRFDDGAAQRVRFNGPADNSSETIFVSDARSFLAKLKGSKNLVLEKTLYQAGDPQFEFSVAGLDWDH